MLAAATALGAAAAFLPAALLSGHRLLVAQGVAQTVAAVCAVAVGAVGVARTHGPDRRWRALVGTNLIVAVFAAVEWDRDVPVLGRTAIGPADLLYLVPSLLVLAGLLWIPAEAGRADYGRGPPRARGARARYANALVTLDGLVIVTSMLLIIWITAQSRILSSGVQGWAFAVAMTFALWGSLEVVVAILVGTFRRPRNGRSLALLAVGLTMQIIPESAAVALSLHGAAAIQTAGGYWAFLTIGPPLVALALVTPEHDRRTAPSWDAQLAPARTARLPSPSASFFLPYLPLAVAVALVLGLAASGAMFGGTVLYLAFALAMAVTVRQLITVAQNVRLLAAVQTAHEQLRHQAFHDPLTGLPNRAHFTRDLERAVTDHRTDNHPVALLFCDLDDFKTINDTLGHAAGDDLLKAVAHRLTTAVRDDDLVARLGGDEFAILLSHPDHPVPGDSDSPAKADAGPPRGARDRRASHPDLDGTDADHTDDPVVVGNRIGKRILAAMAPPFTVYEHRRTMRASVGLAIASRGEPVESADELLHRADSAMYAAKRAAKGSLVAYRGDLDDVGAAGRGRRTSISRTAEDATPDAFTVCYQPIRRLRDGQTTAVEAMLRWTHPLACPTPAREPLAALVRDQRSADLDSYLLDRGCHDLTAVQDRLRAPVRLHLNICPGTIGGHAFVDHVHESLRRHGVPADRLVLEIACTAYVPDLTPAARALRHLAGSGVGIALDEVGALDSSLGALTRLPLSLIKLDSTLSTDLLAPDPSPHGSLAAARSALIGYAATVGLTVAADGIATHAQLAALRAAGCELGQGTLLGPPQPLDELAPVDPAGLGGSGSEAGAGGRRARGP